jgi:GGDEF domain-containing protein
MHVTELSIWSAAAGAIALVVMFGFVDYAISRRVAALYGAVYNAGSLVFALLMSGLAAALLPRSLGPGLRIAQVLAGPMCVLAGNLWIRVWFGARQRDRLMDLSLLFTGLAIPACAVAALFLLPVPQQLPATAALVVLDTALVTWMSVRAWLLGDALALGMSVGALAMVTAAGGLYAIALGVTLSTAMHVLFAMASVLCVTVIGMMLWQRNQHAHRVRTQQDVPSQYDPVTKLPMGLPLVRHLMRAQKRRRMTRREGALIAVLLFEPHLIRSVAGAAGLNEAYLHLSQRLQHHVGIVNPVGRYWERCFIVVVETIRSPASLRTMGLRVATALRRPMDVTASDGRTVQVRPDIGVGVLRLEREHAEIEDLLHEAQDLAQAARAFPSRAATLDPASGRVVPVEDAQLGLRRARLALPAAIARRAFLRRV